MRPANQQQALRQMYCLLRHKLKGSSKKVKEHVTRAKTIAAVIWQRFQVGPYQYQLKHLRWYLETQIQHLKPATRYRHELTVKNIVWTLGKEDCWQKAFGGITPKGANISVNRKRRHVKQ